MGFIKHALIGITLYEVVKYFLNKKNPDIHRPNAGTPVHPATGQHEPVLSTDLIGDKTRKERTDSEDDLQAGSNPQSPLTKREINNDQDDPWRNSLANDEHRAPDS